MIFAALIFLENVNPIARAADGACLIQARHLAEVIMARLAILLAPPCGRYADIPRTAKFGNAENWRTRHDSNV